MRTLLARFATLLAAALLLAGQPAAAGERGWGRASDIGRDALVVAALGLPAVNGDWDGALQAGGSVGAASLVAAGMKRAFPETRPDGSDRRSFPSGHASVAFAAAATLQNRHGWEVGLPAQLVAVLVGVGRVKADKHYWHDVAVGAVVGELSGFLITRRRDDRVRVAPWADAGGGGVALAMRF